MPASKRKTPVGGRTHFTEDQWRELATIFADAWAPRHVRNLLQQKIKDAKADAEDLANYEEGEI